VGLARLILFGLFFYLLYFIVKYVFIRPFSEGYANGGNSKNSNPFNKRKGNITVSYNPEKGSKKGNSVGEYVDYEELED